MIGIDPGSRIGAAMFYGGRELGALTENSVEKLVDLLVVLAKEVPHSSLSVKIGGGEPRSSLRLARLSREKLPPSGLYPRSSMESEDVRRSRRGERSAPPGTSLSRGQDSAFRKGIQFSELPCAQEELLGDRADRLWAELPLDQVARQPRRHQVDYPLVCEARVHEEPTIPTFPGSRTCLPAH